MTWSQFNLSFYIMTTLSYERFVAYKYTVHVAEVQYRESANAGSNKTAGALKL